MEERKERGEEGILEGREGKGEEEEGGKERRNR